MRKYGKILFVALLLLLCAAVLQPFVCSSISAVQIQNAKQQGAQIVAEIERFRSQSGRLPGRISELNAPPSEYAQWQRWKYRAGETKYMLSLELGTKFQRCTLVYDNTSTRWYLDRGF